MPVEVVVSDAAQLFERLDPSPAGRRHLAHGIEEFIVHQAEQRPPADRALLVRIAGRPIGEEEGWLAEAIRHHFAHRAEEEGARVRGLVLDGRRDLAIGLVFLFICGVAAFFAIRVLPGALGIFVEQGLLILGWVALWRPVDLFLYELRPLRVRRRLLESLSRMSVKFDGQPGAVDT